MTNDEIGEMMRSRVREELGRSLPRKGSTFRMRGGRARVEGFDTDFRGNYTLVRIKWLSGPVKGVRETMSLDAIEGMREHERAARADVPRSRRARVSPIEREARKLALDKERRIRRLIKVWRRWDRLYAPVVARYEQVQTARREAYEMIRQEIAELRRRLLQLREHGATVAEPAIVRRLEDDGYWADSVK